MVKCKKYFKGYIDILGQSVYVNSRDGTGLGTVLELMKPTIGYLTKFSASIDMEDKKQDVCVAMIEAVSLYKPQKGKFSAFLFTFVKHKLINQARKHKPEIGYVQMSDTFYPDYETMIDLKNSIKLWATQRRYAVFRVIVNNEPVANVAKDIKMVDWKLRQVIRESLQTSKKFLKEL